MKKLDDNAQFNAQDELTELRRRRTIGHRQSYRKSKLSPYRAELVQLRLAGASFPELATWVRRTTRGQLKPAHTTVIRYLQKLPEFQENSDAVIR